MPNLPVRLTSPVTIICNDAGATNNILAWLAEWNRQGLLDKHYFKLMLEGPAKKIWLEKPVHLANLQLCNDITEAITGASCVLTGTGWSSSLEHLARKKANDLQIPTIAVIDHWVNYEERFERDGEIILPDSIWVSDHYAATLAKSIFKNTHVLELPNTYLDNLVNAITKIPNDSYNLLYVLEPVRSDWGKGNQGEFQALDFFAKNIRSIVGETHVTVTLRPHPSEPPGKYIDWIQSNCNLKVSLNQHKSLNEAISASSWVVGVESFALVIACNAGRSTWTSLPPWAHRCRLPQTGIQHLRDFVSTEESAKFYLP